MAILSYSKQGSVLTGLCLLLLSSHGAWLSWNIVAKCQPIVSALWTTEVLSLWYNSKSFKRLLVLQCLAYFPLFSFKTKACTGITLLHLAVYYVPFTWCSWSNRIHNNKSCFKFFPVPAVCCAVYSCHLIQEQRLSETSKSFTIMQWFTGNPNEKD